MIKISELKVGYFELQCSYKTKIEYCNCGLFEPSKNLNSRGYVTLYTSESKFFFYCISKFRTLILIWDLALLSPILLWWYIWCIQVHLFLPCFIGLYCKIWKATWCDTYPQLGDCYYWATFLGYHCETGTALELPFLNIFKLACSSSVLLPHASILTFLFHFN